jgi:Glu-tRNA(Gln) amidotransferase subunit E-like FAD-binding protein
VNLLRLRRADERAQLVQWRRQYLHRVGVDADLASVVATDLRWDLHALVQLLERGCPPQLAARILEPLDEEHRQ